MVWTEIVRELETIATEYERVNRVISFFQDARLRFRGILQFKPEDEFLLDLGCGPGDFTRLVSWQTGGPVIGVDCSAKMLEYGRQETRGYPVGFVRAGFEELPFRDSTIRGVSLAFSLRDSDEKGSVLLELRRVLRTGARIVVVDIGRPDNRLVESVFSLYMRYVVPLLGGIVAKRGFRNPWTRLFDTYEKLPTNRELRRMLAGIVGSAQVHKYAFGCLVIGVTIQS